ncbi:YcbK family protein [Corallincola spongiicola]|uniref:Murein endopeptidase K n=1 Tax=Corallincola spongiicola TaxID=2520508 RepID=A0ABY1WSW6_9GAMM|nr:DUF882 domain-containing protein [Corallincola spongiicola]TAA47802.1 DUF882 domain-containing protein [Corallincola spongiicola]
MKRRTFIKSVAGSLSAIALNTPLNAMASGSQEQPKYAPLKLHNLHTGERLAIAYADGTGYNADALAQIAHLLRDRRTKEVHPIDVRVLDFLSSISQQIGTEKEIGIISGYRSPKSNAKLANSSNGVAKRSLHMQGKAIDFRVNEVKLSQLRDIAWQCQSGGVGYYPKDQFIHIDCGRTRFWGWHPS